MNEPENIKHVIIDGDVIAYRGAFSAEGKNQKKALEKVDSLVSSILNDTLVFSTGNDLDIYLTGTTNFRHDYAVTHPYKANRPDNVKPTYLRDTREHLIDKYGAVVSEGEEADDLIAIKASSLDQETTVVVSIDKDMKQIPCWHYDYVVKEYHRATEESGLKFFYTQILTGDVADNIFGLYRVGPKKAEKILEGCTTEKELYKATVDAYNGDVERVIENARLLWLRRYEGQIWEPPKL